MKALPAPRHTGTAGVSLLEAVASLLLGLLLMALVLSLLSREREVVAALGRRADALAAVRTVRVVLRREARAVGVGAWASTSDSLALRAFRGSGVVCPASMSGNVILVFPRGIRAADPAKDSVMAMTSGGRLLFRALLAVDGDTGGCGPGPAVGWQRWALSESVPPGIVLARYYERGSYHLAGGAFRYRRGAAGRQPLTPESLHTPASSFRRSGNAFRALLFPVSPGPMFSVDLFVGSGGS